MWTKIKWALAAVVAGVLALLGLLYGKRTASVVRASLRENAAKERVLRTELTAAELRAQAADCAEKRRKHEARAGTLTIELDQVRAARARALGKPEGDDDSIAADDNARRGRPSSA